MSTKAQVYAQYNNARISPKKVAPVMDLVRSRQIKEAEVILAFNPTKAARMILKTLKSAKANAKNNMNLDPKDMYISDIQVNGGRMLKRGRWAGRGRFSRILKRTSHLMVGISSMERGKK